jgi:hypothetical protein
LTTKYGSVDSLNDSVQCGASPNARQIRDIVDCDNLVTAAIDWVEQCVAFGGVASRVFATSAAA